MSTITRSRERIKQTGEIFTPQRLVDEMLMSLCEQDETMFTNPDKTFLEPACGEGAFLVRIVHWKIEFFKAAHPNQPVPIERILRSIYGLDIMADNIEVSQANMLQVVVDHGYDITDEIVSIVVANICCGNALKWDMENWRAV